MCLIGRVLLRDRAVLGQTPAFLTEAGAQTTERTHHALMGPARQKISPVAHVLARGGCFAIGTVYILIGIWAMLALLRVADPAADEGRVLRRMMEFPFGAVFIAVVAGGTIGYVLWLIFEAVFDPYHFGNRWKGVAERIGIGLSTLAYGGIVSAAVQVLLGGGGDGEKKEQLLAGRVLQWPAGHWIMGAAGLLVAGAGLYQVKYVWDGDHKRRLELHGRGHRARLAINLLGWTGYCARCAILLVLGWFMLRATWSSDPRAVGDTDSAFDFLGLNGGPFGDAVFSAVALGTVAYGLFMYVNGIYFRFSGNHPRPSP